mmetsp:Transcript_24310/g.43559  ORF Transcript_24310/g.43559 Transcript_24310/m.43559 type:complete len:212 (-) Transcript_24310:132-767(-)
MGFPAYALDSTQLNPTMYGTSHLMAYGSLSPHGAVATSGAMETWRSSRKILPSGISPFAQIRWVGRSFFAMKSMHVAPYSTSNSRIASFCGTANPETYARTVENPAQGSTQGRGRHRGVAYRMANMDPAARQLLRYRDVTRCVSGTKLKVRDVRRIERRVGSGRLGGQTAKHVAVLDPFIDPAVGPIPAAAFSSRSGSSIFPPPWRMRLVT